MRFLAAIVAFAATLACAADPPPVEHFFQLPRFAAMLLSPDGQTIAALSPVGERQNLVVMDVKTRKPAAVTNFTERDIVAVQWVNSKRLLVGTGRLGVRDFDQRGGALYAVDRDGAEGRMISEGGMDEQSGSHVRFVGRFLQLVRALPGETDDIIAQELVYAAEGGRAGELFRVNTRTGRRTSISLGRPDNGEEETWVVDNKGVPRTLTVESKGRVRIHYRASEEAPWRKLDDFSATAQGWRPLAVADDGRTLLVSDQRQRDKAAIVRYDPETKSFGEILAEHPQVDLDKLISYEGRPLGVYYNADRIGSAWFDAEMARLQNAVDRALPSTVNILSWARDCSLLLVTAFSDTLPFAYYLLDTKGGRMEWLVDGRPWINPKEMAPMKPVRYKARDGLEIPAYLTLPRSGSKNLPLVVMVHGGPWVQGDTWGFNEEAQFLASRGYAVLQPNFRGTTRYGWKHYSSSFKQWGLAMQDDVTDGVRWAIAEGIADPKRVCIYGASYGGYATMMGLAKDPDLYRCGINYLGVTDLDLLLTATWSDFAHSEFLQYNAKDVVGDASKDTDRLKQVSPVHLAARIKAPVLMAYGAADYRVPIEHGTRMRSALERAGHRPIWIVADGEGHGFRDMKNQKMFYEAMEKFLAEHIGKP